jgi:hypothetical protein
VFDLTTFCENTKTCQVPAGVGIDPGNGGDDEFAVGSFETWPDEKIAIPVAGFRNQVACKPPLVAAARGGAPLDGKPLR